MTPQSLPRHRSPFYTTLLKRPARYLHRRWVLPILILAVFLIQFGSSLSDIPTVRISQDVLCHPYIIDAPTPGRIPEDQCQLVQVQRELNIISVGGLVSQTIGAALAALPFGALSDRLGRVAVLGFVVVGLLAAQAFTFGVLSSWQTIPLRVTWAAGAFYLIGGGMNAAEAVVFTIVSDISSEKKRAISFQWIACSVLAAQLVAQPVSGALMRTSSVWLPMWLGLVFMAVGGLIAVLFLPETRKWNLELNPPELMNESRTLGDNILHLSSSPSPSPLSPSANADQPGHRPVSFVSVRTARAVRRLSTVGVETKTSMWTVLKSFRRLDILLLVPAVTFSIPMVSAQLESLFRMMPVAFGWTLEDSALLISLRSGITIVVLAVILPLAKLALVRLTAMSSFRQDHRLAQASAVCLVIGSVLTMLLLNPATVWSGVMLSSLGAAVPTLCRALLVGLVTEKGLKGQVGGLFGALAVLETVVFVVFYLSLGALFDVSLETWKGWPFALALMVGVVITITLWLVKEPKGGGGVTTDADVEKRTRLDAAGG